MIHDIYICCSHEDIRTIESIREELIRRGFSVYMDDFQMVGSDFAQELTKRIREVEYVLFFYGNYTSNSIWAKREIEYALAQQKKIIPIVLGNAIVDEWFGFYLKRYNWINFKESSDSTNINTIISFLQPSPFKSEANEYKLEPPTVSNSRPPSRGPILAISAIFWGVIIIWGVFRLCRPTDFSPNFECESDNAMKFPFDTLAADSVVVEFNEEKNDVPYISKVQHESFKDTNYHWFYLLLSFFAGGGVIMLFQKIMKPRKGKLKLSSDISAKVFIDGDIKKEIISREVYEAHLDKGVYLVDFEDIKDNRRHRTFNHVVDSNECKLLFAQFEDNSMQNNKTIKCFIAGSTLLQHERDALRAVTCIMYNKWSTKNFRILSYTFEDFERAAVIGGHQKQYDNFIMDEADWALFIIDGAIGGITVREFLVAMDSYKRNGRPKILALAKVGTEDREDIAEIKEAINKEHQYWTDYTDINSLKHTFESTLNWDLIELFQNQ